MGRVHAAYDELLSREVAVKLLHDGDARDPELLERFRREARSAGSLSHPNAVRVFDAGYAEGPRGPFPYIAMELVRGGTLKERLRRVRGRLLPREAATLALGIAGALGEAHDLGIVHRDVKPENVLLGERGQAKVADFGIARVAEAATMTRTGWVFGTAAYVSPEQAAGEPSGPSADLYSLGVVLYEMLVGRPPFGSEGPDTTPLAIAMRHLREDPVPPRRREPSVPPGLERIALALLRKRPQDRYESAGALASDLERFLGGEEPLLARSAATPPIPASASAGPGRRRPRAKRWRRRRRPVVAALAFVLAVTAFGVAAPGVTASGGAAAAGLLGRAWGAWVSSVPVLPGRIPGVGRPALAPRVIEPYPISQLRGRPAVDLSGSGGSPDSLAGFASGGAAREDRQAPLSNPGRVKSADTQTHREPPQEQTVLHEERAPEQTFAQDSPAEPRSPGSTREPEPPTEP